MSAAVMRFRTASRVLWARMLRRPAVGQQVIASTAPQAPTWMWLEATHWVTAFRAWLASTWTQLESVHFLAASTALLARMS